MKYSAAIQTDNFLLYFSMFAEHEKMTSKKKHHYLKHYWKNQQQIIGIWEQKSSQIF